MRTVILCRRFFCTLFFFCCILLCVSACTQTIFPFLGTHETVVLHVPLSHPDYLLFIDEKGESRKMALNAGQAEVCFILPKNRVTPFLFYKGESDTCPIGCIYPYDTASDRAGGFTAFVLYRLFICSENEGTTVYGYVSCFNWARLKEIIYTYEEPWELDDALIAEKIAEGTFSIRHIKKRF